MTKAKRDRIEVDKRNSVAVSKQTKLEAYLTAPRVKQLLSPFCDPGRTVVGAWNHKFRIDELEPRPISLNRLTTYKHSGIAYKPLEPTRTGLSNLIKLANLKDNDRGSWPTDKDSWESAGITFKDMGGNMVNPYHEAQRILREHGQSLVDLGMLVK